MDLSRRALIAGLSAACLPLRAGATEDAPAFVAACRRLDGSFAAVVLSGEGDVLLSKTLHGRGHDAAIRKNPPTAVMFARRPGTFALVIELDGSGRTTAFAPPPSRRFAGHGFFSPDGKTLFATENDFEGERGVIGLYDATDGYRRVGEFSTYGMGPHEALLLSDGRTIAVANGGILTHPDYPRMKLNIPTMAPSLALIDVRNGALLGKAALGDEYHQVSIRHMAEAGSGELWFGGQYEGPKTDTPPLVGTFDADRGLRLVSESERLTAAMNHYVGSVAASLDGGTVLVTSPRGGLVAEWDVAARSLRKTVSLVDACGAAPAEDGFAVTTGTGVFLRDGAMLGRENVAWDNHLAGFS
ncbi:MAG: DUF1513 domain-containing protein [Pseudomonadota bacterium]